MSLHPTPPQSTRGDRPPSERGDAKRNASEEARRLAAELERQGRAEQEELRRVLALGEAWRERSEALEAQMHDDSFLWQQQGADLELRLREEQQEQVAALQAAQQEGLEWQHYGQVVEARLAEWEAQGASRLALLEDAQQEGERVRVHNARLEEQLRESTKQEQAERRCLESEAEALRQRHLLLEVRLSRAELERDQSAEAAEQLRKERSALQQAEQSGEAWRLQSLQLGEQLQQATRERDRLVEVSNELRADHRRLEAAFEAGVASAGSSPVGRSPESPLERTLLPPEAGTQRLPAGNTPTFFGAGVVPVASTGLAAAAAPPVAAATAPPGFHSLRAPPPLARRESLRPAFASPVASPASLEQRAALHGQHSPPEQASSSALVGSPQSSSSGGPQPQQARRSHSSPALAATFPVAEAGGFRPQPRTPQELPWPPSPTGGPPAVAPQLPVGATDTRRGGGSVQMSASKVLRGSGSLPSSSVLASASGPTGSPTTPQRARGAAGPLAALHSTAPGGQGRRSLATVMEPIVGGSGARTTPAL